MFEALLALVLLVPAAIYDIKTKRIPNEISFSCIILGIALTCIRRPKTIWTLIIAFILLFVAGCIKMLGWGDSKCLMALTAIIGWKMAATAFLGSQLLMVGHYLISLPKTATKGIKNNIIQISQKKIVIDKYGHRKPLAPYLLIAYIITAIVMIVM